MVRVFANGPEDLGSVPSRVIRKTQKMVFDATLLNIQHYKVRIKGKMEQSRERNCALPLHLDVEAVEKEAFGSPSTMVTNFILLNIYMFMFLLLMFLCVCIYILKSNRFECIYLH